MRRALMQALAEPGTHWFLLALALLLFSWPLLGLLAEGSWIAVMCRFFISWGVILGLLALVARAASRRDTPR